MSRRKMRVGDAMVALVALLVLTWPAFGFSQAVSSAPSAAPNAVDAALTRGDYQEALRQVQLELKTTPNDLALRMQRIKAEMGLHQDMDAARQAMALALAHPHHPEFRLTAGVCAFQMGYVAQALQQWLQLKDTPGWQEKAYHLSIQALMATGQFGPARKLALDAVSNAPHPWPLLVSDLCLVDHSPKDCLPPLQSLLSSKPEHSAYFAQLEGLLKSAGPEGLFRYQTPSATPLTIPLKEKNVQMDVPVVGEIGDYTVSSWQTYSTSSSVVVPVSIGGAKERWMVLDSGSSVMLIGEGTAKSLHLKPISPAQYTGLGSGITKQTEWVLCPTVAVGGVVVRNVPAMVIAKHSDFWERRGICPLSLFRPWAVLFDRRHGRMTLYPSGTDPGAIMGPGTFRLPAVWNGAHPCAEISIQGHPGCFCAIDTGAVSTAIVGQYAKSVGVQPLLGRFGGVHNLTVSGTFDSGLAENVSIQFGTQPLHMGVVQVAPFALHGLFFPVYANLGRDILDLYEGFYDWPHDVVAFKAYDKG